MPAITRQNARSQIANGSIWPMELITNSIAATCMDLVRPSWSASLPPVQAPAAEPSSAIATTTPVSTGPDPKWFWIPTTAPLMTALSYPKRNPPTAAAAAMNTTCLRRS